MPKTVLTVFLSSTGLDLKPYRDELHRQITGCDLLKCVRMEDFGPQDAESVDYCKKSARDADIYIGIIGHRRGWEPKGDNAQRSITEIEYESSKERGRPRFIAIAPSDFPVPGHLREPDEVDARQVAFRSRVGSERVAGVHNFKSPETLAAEFMTKLLSHIISSDLIKDVRPDLAASIQNQDVTKQQSTAIAAAFEKLADDEQIDLLAMARNPHGIDIAELEGKLIAQAELHSARSMEERRNAAECWRHVGALAHLDNTQKALSAYRKAVDLNPEDPIATGNLGILLLRVGDLDQAEEMQLKSIAINEVLGDMEGLSRQYCNLGNVYGTRGSLDKAEEMYRKSLAIAISQGRKEGLANQYGNLGNIYGMRGDLDRAEEMYMKCLAIEETLGRKKSLANANGNLGNVHFARGDLDQAEKMYCKSLSLNEEVGSKDGMAKQYNNLGILSERKGNISQAVKFWTEARDLYRTIGNRNEQARLETWIADADES